MIHLQISVVRRKISSSVVWPARSFSMPSSVIDVIPAAPRHGLELRGIGLRPDCPSHGRTDLHDLEHALAPAEPGRAAPVGNAIDFLSHEIFNQVALLFAIVVVDRSLPQNFDIPQLLGCFRSTGDAPISKLLRCSFGNDRDAEFLIAARGFSGM